MAPDQLREIDYDIAYIQKQLDAGPLDLSAARRKEDERLLALNALFDANIPVLYDCDERLRYVTEAQYENNRQVSIWRRKEKWHRFLINFWDAVRDKSTFIMICIFLALFGLVIPACSLFVVAIQTGLIILLIAFSISITAIAALVLIRSDYLDDVSEAARTNADVATKKLGLLAVESRLHVEKVSATSAELASIHDWRACTSQSLRKAEEYCAWLGGLSDKKMRINKLREERQELIDLIQSKRYQLSMANWRDLRGPEFELFLTEVFEYLGYHVVGTKVSGDQGIDLIATKNDKKIGIQAKGYADSVGNHAVMEAHAGMAYYQCNVCIVITNSEFTRHAKDLATKIGCWLISKNEMIDLIHGKRGL